jgi:hypothetical protein
MAVDQRVGESHRRRVEVGGMKLLDHYLRAVRMYLPRGPQQDDIIKELSANLLAELEEHEYELGRPLSEPEQEAILTAHGHPMAVAARYGAVQRGVAFGWQLISPEVFPLYIRVLLAALLIGIAVNVVITFALPTAAPIARRLLNTASVQFLVITLCFVVVDFFQRRGSMHWTFPPPYLAPVPRTQSACGLAFWSAVSLWWVLVPHFPRLVLGPAAARVTLTPTWDAFFWPVLLLSSTGVAQRALTLARPDLNWVQAITRLTTSVVGLVVLAVFLRSGPYVTVADGLADLAAAHDTAGRANTMIWWNAAAGVGIYVLIVAGFQVWLCVQLVGYHRRRVRSGAASR